MKQIYKNFIGLVLCVGVCMTCLSCTSSQQQETSKTVKAEDSRCLSKKAWETYGQREFEKAIAYAQQCIKQYAKEAQAQQTSLNAFANLGHEEDYLVLNDVGSCYFILGETYRKLRENDKAIEAFQTIIDTYGYSQYWSERGWYWQLAPAAAETIRKLQGTNTQIIVEDDCKDLEPLVLSDPGIEEIVDYSQYGIFENSGTKDYKYVITDRKGLKQAVGEGIYPNNQSAYRDPAYQQLQTEGKLEGNHWEFVNSGDPRKDFYKWATVGEEPAVKLFYTALALEEAGLIVHAIKAYHAVAVNFPKAIGWTFWHSPWYVGQAALNSILNLTEAHPQLGMKLIDARIQVINGFNEDINDDEVIVNPGKIISVTPEEVLRKKPEMDTMKIIQTRGKGEVQLIQYENGHWQMLVNGEPFIIKGITYTPTPIGQSPDEGTLEDWMTADINKNGKNDGAFDTWVDANRNNIQDKDEPVVGDFQLMKDMGINTLRVYHQPHKLNKELLRTLYNEYGIRIILGDFFGMYAIGSGANWHPGTDYSNPEHRENMKKSVRKMVMEFRDEPYVLMWLLGNENNYGVANNAKSDPVPYYEFADEVAKMIKELDPGQRPVAIGNGDLAYLDIFGEKTSTIDVFGTNAYRGKHGFGRSFWKDIQVNTDRPVVITEYGCPAFMHGCSLKKAEQAQAEYLVGTWKDIECNSSGNEGIGNALGAVLFEWIDEWWKAYEPYEHDFNKNWAGPFPDGWMYEEWLGVASQGNGKNSPFCRVLRKAYFSLKKLWNN